MRLHRLEITAMGPFAETETVDFDRLDRAGVYLLTGRTGSGKTTVLDAVSYALFGLIPRDAKGNEVVSDHRRIETTPQVVLEATIGGQRQRITRSPSHERPSRRGGGTTNESHSLLVEDMAGGEWVQTAGGWNDGNVLLKDRVGMTAEQFNQVVMLPQGQFEKFLDAGADERRRLLQRLFPATDLEWLEQWLRREADAARERRDSALAEIGNHFQRVRPVARKLLPQDATPGAEEPDPLPEHGESGPALAWIENTGTRLAEIAADRERARQRSHDRWDAAARELHRLEKRADLIRKRRAADEQLAKLSERREWREETRRKVEAARRAAPVGPLAAAAERHREAAARAETELNRLKPLVDESRLTAGISAEDLGEHRDRLNREAEQVHDFIWQELPQRAVIEEQVAELEATLENLTTESPESPVGKAVTAVRLRQEEAEAAARRYIEVRRDRTNGMARELAGTLKAGEPCPVCGSLEHPAPAEGADRVPSEEDERRAEAESEEARREETASAEALAELRKEVAERKAATETELKNRRLEAEKLVTRERELRGEHERIEDRLEELTGAVSLLDRFLQAGDDLRVTGDAATEATAAALAEAERSGFDSVEAALAAAIEPSDLKRLVGELDEFDRNLSIVNSELAGELAGVDPAETVDLDPASAAEKETGRARDTATREAGSADDDLRTFRREMESIPGLYAELVPLREKADRAAELDRLASGRNERRMRLSIFFLASRLRQVIEAANAHLVEMTDQRYTLAYSDEGRDGRSQSGLEIEVYDAHTSNSRPTATLSGGEKFCAALSLALGLAEVVQSEADARSLQTLFIDEGFGTLDAKSLEQVMTVIDSLRGSGRSVGLVSHVEELRDRIPAQIRVTAGPDGSTLEVVA